MDCSWEVPEVGSLRQVVICGMGGSAIGGDFHYSLPGKHSCLSGCGAPQLWAPGWPQDRSETLGSAHPILANTEETLSSFNEALQRGCSLMSICTGGKLADLSKEKMGKNCWIFDHVGQPRTAIGWTVGLLLALFFRLGSDRRSNRGGGGGGGSAGGRYYKTGEGQPVSHNPAQTAGRAIAGSQHNHFMGRVRWR